MTITWQTTKKQIGVAITDRLASEPSPFVRKGRSLEWYRRFSGVLQLILIERTKGARLRLRAFAATHDGQTVGGNVTETTIEGGGIAGNDRLWGTGTDQEINASIEEIWGTLAEIVLPWFRTMTDQVNIVQAIEEYPGSGAYSIKPAEYPTISEGSEIGINGVQRVCLEEFYLAVEQTVQPDLSGLGFLSHTTRGTFVRRRRTIFDVIEIVPFNYGTKYCCYAYNWIAELSATGDEVFTSDSRVMLVGGLLKESWKGRERLAVFESIDLASAEASLQTLCLRIRDEVDDKLLRVANRSDFIAAAKQSHPVVAAAFDLC